ncbi:MAG TPA: phytanoyl-CoA dioxygenase family protein, partial [Terriglobales bacterium]|nr:phytanoyl-CoA dioxygenase family protein [Terriglobales bacterium]
ASIKEKGFATVPGVLSARELIPVLVSLADLKPLPHRAGVRHVLSHPTVSVMAHGPRLMEMARAILGDSALPFRATLFDKTPDKNWLITWHQDTALPLQEMIETPGWGPWSEKEGVTYAHAPAAALEQVLALRLHLDDSTEMNGPLRVLPGTHELGVLNDEEIERHATYEEAVELPMAKGGVIAMRPLVIHASSKSRSQTPRRILHIEYSAQKEFYGSLKLALA